MSMSVSESERQLVGSSFLVAVCWWQLVGGSLWWKFVGGNWSVDVCWWQLVGGSLLVAIRWRQLVGGDLLAAVCRWQFVGGREEEEGGADTTIKIKTPHVNVRK